VARVAPSEKQDVAGVSLTAGHQVRSDPLVARRPTCRCRGCSWRSPTALSSGKQLFLMDYVEGRVQPTSCHYTSANN